MVLIKIFIQTDSFSKITAIFNIARNFQIIFHPLSFIMYNGTWLYQILASWTSVYWIFFYIALIAFRAQVFLALWAFNWFISNLCADAASELVYVGLTLENFCLLCIFLQILTCIKLSFDVFDEVFAFCFLVFFPFGLREIFLLTFNCCEEISFSK